MRRWDLTAPRDDGRTGPRALFSTAEARAIVVDLGEGEEMGDHRVRERAIVHVLRGRVAIAAGTSTASCDEGTLVVFDLGEDHSVRAVQPSRLLLLLAPWPAPGHHGEGGSSDPHELPVNAQQDPLDDRDG